MSPKAWGGAPGYINVAQSLVVTQAILMSPRWGLPGSYTGYINVAPLGLVW